MTLKCLPSTSTNNDPLPPSLFYCLFFWNLCPSRTRKLTNLPCSIPSMRTTHLLGSLPTLLDYLLHRFFFRELHDNWDYVLQNSLPLTPSINSNPFSFRPINECTLPFPLPPLLTPIPFYRNPSLSKTDSVLPQLHEFPTPIMTMHPYPLPLWAKSRPLFMFLPPSLPPALVLLVMSLHLSFNLTPVPVADLLMATFLVVQFEARVFTISKGVVLWFLFFLLTSCWYIFFD